MTRTERSPDEKFLKKLAGIDSSLSHSAGWTRAVASCVTLEIVKYMTMENPPATSATMKSVMPAWAMSGTERSGTATPMMNSVRMGVASPRTAMRAAIAVMIDHEPAVPFIANCTRSRQVASR